MANHPQALKRAKQNEKRRIRNRHAVTTCRSMVKKVRLAVEAKDPVAAAEALADASRALASAASKGILHKSNASRRIGRLAHAVAALKA